MSSGFNFDNLEPENKINWDDDKLISLAKNSQSVFNDKKVKKMYRKDQMDYEDGSKNWFKLNRQAFNNYDLTKNPELFIFFLWLVSKAFFEPMEYRGRIWQKGEGFCGNKEVLAKFPWLTRQKYRSLFKLIEKCNFATIKPTHIGTEFIILNYSKYQGGEDKSNQPTNQPTNQPPTTIKNYKNYIRNKENIKEKIKIENIDLKEYSKKYSLGENERVLIDGYLKENREFLNEFALLGQLARDKHEHVRESTEYSEQPGELSESLGLPF